jgi:hypothetical protein
LEKIGNITWTTTSSSAHTLCEAASGDPHLDVEVSCKTREQRWLLFHPLLHSFVERCVRSIEGELNTFIAEQRQYFAENHDTHRTGHAEVELLVTARDGKECMFKIAVTLDASSIPNEVLRKMCGRIVQDVKSKFTVSALDTL